MVLVLAPLNKNCLKNKLKGVAVTDGKSSMEVYIKSNIKSSTRSQYIAVNALFFISKLGV